MMISSVVRERAPGRSASAGAVSEPGGEAQANSAEAAQHPFAFAGNDRLDDRQAPGPSKGSTLPLADLEAEARYARERYELYRAKAYGPRLTSAGRLRELERKSKLAASRLHRARADQ